MRSSFVNEVILGVDLQRKWDSMLEDYPDLLGQFHKGSDIPEEFKLIDDKGKGPAQERL